MRNGKTEGKLKFSIVQGRSMFSSEEVCLIRFDEGQDITKSFSIKSDTLSLKDEV